MHFFHQVPIVRQVEKWHDVVCIHTYMYPIIYITIASFIYISLPRVGIIHKLKY